MTSIHRATGVALTCPRCARNLTADLWVLADAGRFPEVVDAALAGALNRVECGTCHQRFLAPTPVLFCDPARGVALAYIPAALGDDPEALVTALLARLLQAAPETAPEEWLLEPTVYREPEAFAAALTGAGTIAAGEVLHPGLAEAAQWCRQSEEEEVARALDALGGVADLPQFLAVANQRPDLLDPRVMARMAALADRAEVAGQSAVAELLRDLAAALRLHAPAHDDEPDDELTAELGEQLAAGDLEVAADYLERPATVPDEAARRAMVTSTEPELREGFTEHARLFGGLLDAMLDGEQAVAEQQVQKLLAEEPGPLPDGLPELLASPTVETVLEVLARFPGLISSRAVSLLRRAEARALDEGDESWANYLEMLVHTIYVAAEDEDQLEDDSHDDPA